MATAEYTVGVMGAVIIAGLVLRFGLGDDSFFQSLLKGLLERIKDFIPNLLKVWQRIG